MKICSKCGEEKRISEFQNRKDRDRSGIQVTRINRQCKSCLNKKQKEWIDENPHIKAKKLSKMKEAYNADSEKFREKSRKWREKNKDKMAENYRKWHEARDRFEVSLATAAGNARRDGYAPCSATQEEIRAAFTGKCAICGCPEVECKSKLRMDHSHSTGEFRGWLCHRCNATLGFINDSEGILHNMLHYLKCPQTQ